MPQRPDNTTTFTFNLSDADALKDVRDNLSAIVLHKDTLWLGGDEGTSIHRMTRDGGNYGKHVSIELKDRLRLPLNNPKEEIDFEGLEIDGGFLWLTGSHSAKREKPKEKKSAADNIGRLSDVKVMGNRFTLGRISLRADGTDFEQDNDGARLDGDASGNDLTRALAGDPHLGGFVPSAPQKSIASKDNGFDIEGLAVSSNRVFLGLRGPVLRGWTVILELRLSEGGQRRLKLDPVGTSGALFHKHFLELKGLGIRDLAIDGDDLLILTGPTMVLDGPVFLYRWKNALNQTSDAFVWHRDLKRLMSLPCGNDNDKTEGKDHAEGIALVKDPLSVIVCYDSPSDSRIKGPQGASLTADIFHL